MRKLPETRRFNRRGSLRNEFDYGGWPDEFYRVNTATQNGPNAYFTLQNEPVFETNPSPVLVPLHTPLPVVGTAVVDMGGYGGMLRTRPMPITVNGRRTHSAINHVRDEKEEKRLAS